jgi:DNA-binding transcriptional LysR family regulator
MLRVETRLLGALVELHRRGTMRAVAEATGYGTSAISAQLAAPERDLGVELIEQVGRKVRLVTADLGIALVPASVPAREGVNLVPMSADGPLRRTYAATRPGRQDWPAAAVVIERVTAAHARRIT